MSEVFDGQEPSVDRLVVDEQDGEQEVRQLKSARTTFVTLLLMASVAVLLYNGAEAFPREARRGPQWVALMSVGLVGLGLLQAVRRLTEIHRDGQLRVGLIAPQDILGPWMRTAAATVMMIVLMPRIGFLPSAVLLLVVLSIALAPRPTSGERVQLLLSTLAYGVLSAVSVWFLFARVLGLRLPRVPFL